MSRLLLLCGDPGTGVAAHAEATALALAAEGLTVGRVAVAECATGAASDAAMASIAAVLDATLGELGAEALPTQAWTDLPGLGALAALSAIADEVDDHEVVVVDAGDLRSAQELVALPSLLVRLLDALMTPRLAMWRPAGSTRAPFDVLSDQRLRAMHLESMLRRPTTTMRLIARPEPGEVDRILRAGAAVAMLGIGVDGYVLAPFPRSSDGKGVRRRAERLLDELADAVEGVAVWRSTKVARAVPKGRSAVGPLGRVQVLDAEQLTVHASEESFALELPLAGPARAQARVGVSGDRLVIAFDGSTRWLDLPPVLQRCTPVDAVRTSAGVRVEFRPDPAVWPTVWPAAGPTGEGEAS